MSGTGRGAAVSVAWGVVRVVVVAAAAAGLVQGATGTSWSLDLREHGAGATGPASTTTVVTDATLTCPGPDLTGIVGVADTPVPALAAAAAAPADLVRSVSGADPGTGSLAIGMLDGTSRVRTAARAVPIATVVTGRNGVLVEGTAGLAPGVAATQEWTVDSATLRGLVTLPCGPATSESWLVAGGGEPGRQERLLLVNPGANEVSVDVSVLGAKGPISSAVGHGIVVPAHGRAGLLVDAISGAQASPVVHVVVTGGVVRATLNDSWLDGTVPTGSSTVGPTASPATHLVIPAVPVLGGGSLRVADPGSSDAVVKVRILGPEGGAPLPSGGVLTVRAGSVAEVSLASLPAATTALEITADSPVVAGAVVTLRNGTSPGDLAWAAATEPIDRLGGLVLPATKPAPTRTLALVASGGSVSVEVTTVDAAGAPHVVTVRVPADATASVPLGTAASVWLRPAGSGALRAAVVSTVGSGAAQLVSVAPVDSTAVSVERSTILTIP